MLVTIREWAEEDLQVCNALEFLLALTLLSCLVSVSLIPGVVCLLI